MWERLWRHRPSDGRDDALLERERRSPRWRLIVQRLEATFGSIAGLETVELGSGRGDLSTLLARHGARVTLLDASERALDQARRRFDRLGLTARFEQADLFELPETWQRRFDLSLSSGVVEHFRGDARTRVLRVHHDVLRPGGLSLISVPHAWCLPYRLWKFYLELRGWWPYGMEIPYSRRELVRRAREVGFARTETRCMGFLQSVGAHWGSLLLNKRPEWTDRPSWLDSTMGFTLLLLAWTEC